MKSVRSAAFEETSKRIAANAALERAGRVSQKQGKSSVEFGEFQVEAPECNTA